MVCGVVGGVGDDGVHECGLPVRGSLNVCGSCIPTVLLDEI